MQSNDKDGSMVDGGDGCWLAAIEDDYLQSIGAEPDYEHQYAMERDASMRAMWGSFQESATSIAQLYRDRLSTNETGALWLPFQTAAGTVTSLYKESSDGLRRTSETAHRSGYQRRTRELAEWARKKNRRYIRREDLLAYLAGKKPAPPTSASASTAVKPPAPQHSNSNSTATHHPHHHPGHHIHTSHSNQHSGGTHQHTPAGAVGHNYSHHHHNHHHSHHHSQSNLEDGVHGGPLGGSDGEQLHTFKEALARRQRTPDLYAFVADEIARHSKRPASPLDINMDAQQQNIGGKRQRFL